MNQVEAAEWLVTTPDRYREWESDKGDHIPRRTLGGGLQSHERCFILRRRANLTQRELAHLLGCTRLWVIQMEDGRGPVERLKQYWGV